MTDLRQAAQQALEALGSGNPYHQQLAAKVLRTALEQQAEPPPEWLLIKNILAEYGLDAIAFVAEWKAAQQKAEPTCPDCKAAVLYECVACSSNNYPPKQQAEPVAREGFEKWAKFAAPYMDISRFGAGYSDSNTDYAWVGWQAAQRKELSASEILNMMPSAIPAEYDGELMEFARAIEAKLKEKNNG